MAKLKAPLLSFSATGAIAKAIVFFGWKGLNVARQYVVPSNPNTVPQQTQRGFLRDAVALIHACQAWAGEALVEADQVAYALLGSLQPTPRTWFNTCTKQYMDQHIASLKGAFYRLITCTPGVDLITVKGWFTKEGVNDITTLDIKYGTVKSNLIATATVTKAEFNAGYDIGGLVTGTKYYIQVRPTAHADFVGANSGIYHAVVG